jgi:hypothetical protein
MLGGPQRCRSARKADARGDDGFPRECSGRAISQMCGFPHRSTTAQTARVGAFTAALKTTHKAHCRPPPAAKRPRARRNGRSVRRGRQRERECAPNVPQMSAALTDRSSSRAHLMPRGLSILPPAAQSLITATANPPAGRHHTARSVL